MQAQPYTSTNQVGLIQSLLIAGVRLVGMARAQHARLGNDWLPGRQQSLCIVIFNSFVMKLRGDVYCISDTAL